MTAPARERFLFCARRGASDGLAGREYDPVGIEVELYDFACGKQPVIELCRRGLAGVTAEMNVIDGNTELFCDGVELVGVSGSCGSAYASPARSTPAPHWNSV